MRVIPPVIITDEKFISSTLPEVASAAYNGATTYALYAKSSVAGALGLITEYASLQAANTGHAPAASPTWWKKLGDTYQVFSMVATYALGERVIDPVAHLVYESLVDDNVGNALTAAVEPLKWLLVGFTNKWAMFDSKSNAPTIAPGSHTFTIAPGERCDSILLYGMVANNLEIVGTNGGVVIYNYSENLNEREVFDGRDYCFKPFSTKPTVIRFNIPLYSGTEFTITLSVTTGNTSLVHCIMGLSVYVGDVHYNAKCSGDNYSTVDRKFDGNINKMIPRRNVPTNSLTIDIDRSKCRMLRKLIEILNGTVAVLSGVDDDSDGYFDPLLIVGFITHYEFDLNNSVGALLMLNTESI
ncbi:MAG: hypothetical protein Q8L79_03360 [Methylobacter sp.]|uniref:hypothetical protein n=1 Tax=Methylobacter sp. TaxID=2051955 RepID=UPI00272F1551|nr:hypothetical protein [Methylobacter sp.]MDP1664140.1 hypothetical protein [Methylobacter sp.]